jgi:hypothetical protein
MDRQNEIVRDLENSLNEAGLQASLKVTLVNAYV